MLQLKGTKWQLQWTLHWQCSGNTYSNESKTSKCSQMQPMESMLFYWTHGLNTAIYYTFSTTLKSSLQREIRKDGIHFKTEVSENQHNTDTKHSISNAVISQAQVKIQEWPNNHQISGLIKRNALLHKTWHTGITKASIATLEKIKHY